MKKYEVEKLLSLNGVKVENIEERTKDNKQILEVSVKSIKNKARCPYCSNFSNIVFEHNKPQKLLYLRAAEKETYLIVHKRRFKCKKCNKTFTEDLGLSDKKGRISLKVKQKILRDLLDKDKTIRDIAKENNVKDDCVREIFIEATKGIPKRVEYLPEVISFDENSTYTNEGTFSFILNDPIHQITLDILKSREKDYLVDYFLKVKNRKNVKVVIIDLYKPYKSVAKICFPNAIIVGDPFHYTKIVTQELNNLRNRLIKKYENNKKSPEYKTLKSRRNAGLLLKTFGETRGEQKKKKQMVQQILEGKTKKKIKDKFNDYWFGEIKIMRNNKYVMITRIGELNRMLSLDKELLDSYNLKEEFMRIVNNVKYEDIRKNIIKWIKQCKDSNILEMISASETIENWLDEIVNSFIDERYSNGFTEANNKIIDRIVANGYGYKNFEFFRLRALVILRKSYSIGTRKNLK